MKLAILIFCSNVFLVSSFGIAASTSPDGIPFIGFLDDIRFKNAATVTIAFVFRDRSWQAGDKSPSGIHEVAIFEQGILRSDVLVQETGKDYLTPTLKSVLSATSDEKVVSASGNLVDLPKIVLKKSSSPKKIWLASKLSKTELSNLEKHFISDISRSITNCIVEGQSASESKAYRVNRRNLKVKKVVRGSGGDIIAGIQVDLATYKCDGPTPEEWTILWYYLDRKKPILFVGRNMSLIEVGDYNNDGNEEALFFGRFNDDGYVLATDKFSKLISYSWKKK